MKRARGFLCNLIVLLATMWSMSAQAVTVTDRHGTFHLDDQPKRIVALEFSFVDALAAVGVSPVGIADDNDPGRVMSALRDKLDPWQSVGTRSQPSLEVIASLKPDLIIADVSRHSAIYQDLKKIAPTLLLASRRETYTSNLQSAAIIGKAIGKNEQMQARLARHQQRMQQYKQKLAEAGLTGKVVQFGVARENGFYAHAGDSYAGGVIRALGLQGSPMLRNENASRQVSLEQLLALNPDYLIVGDYVSNSIIKKWSQQSLWKVLTAVRDHHVYAVDGNLWSRCRGILAAEIMADDLMQLTSAKHH